MGQKISPLIFQLTKTNNWQSKYLEKKVTEYSKYSKKDIEIRSFIQKFFENYNRMIHRCKICYFENSLHIFVSYYLNAKPFSLAYHSIPYADRHKVRKRSEEYVKVSRLVDFQIQKEKRGIIQILEQIKCKKVFAVHLLFKTKEKLKRVLKVVRSCWTKGPYYFKKALGSLNLVIFALQKCYTFLTIANKFLIKFIRVLNKITHKLMDQKLKRKEEWKEVFVNKLTASLKDFNSENCRLRLHFKTLNISRSKESKKKILDILKKKLIKLRKYREEKFYQEGVNILLTCATIRKPSTLLIQFLSVQLKMLKNHNFFLNFIKDALLVFNKYVLSKIKRIQIQIKGRLNARPKAKSRVLKIGKDISVLTIDSVIDYSEKTAFTLNGTLGIKVWIHEFSN